MKKYPSEISIGLSIFVLTILIGTSLPMISLRLWSGLLINIFILLFIVYIFLSTFYSINGNTLIVKSGFLVNKKIDIHKVELISESNSIVSAPAISFNKLDIIYNGHERVMISPRHKKEFIGHMTRINPAIKVQIKDKS